MTPLLERLVFDLEAGEVRDADRRYLLIRPDVLMGALARLDVTERSRVLQAFADAATEHGGKSVRDYLGEGESIKLPEMIQGTAAALGWGSWTFEPAPSSLSLVVRNSPFAAGFGPSDHPVCAPISGLLRSVAEHELGGPVVVSETHCAAQGGRECCFTAMRE